MTDYILISGGSLIVGAVAKEIAQKVVARFWNGAKEDANGIDKKSPSYWKEVIRDESGQAVENALRITVVPMLAANQKTLDQLAQINGEMKDALLRLVVLQEVNSSRDKKRFDRGD